jgi:glyoxylase-like metal-dependent hydrolase (beta-lactamase superfamily II)
MITLNLGNMHAYLLEEGKFSLDPGAAFGTVPKPIWSRFVQPNMNYRIPMAANVVLVDNGNRSILVDSGLGSGYEEKFSSIFEINHNAGFLDELEGIVKAEKIGHIIHSHLHFDHCGNSLYGNTRFPEAKLVFQKKELANLKHPNDLSRYNYRRPDRSIRNIVSVDGSSIILGFVRLIRTGGHTSGHQAVIIEGSSAELIYFGDIMPSSVHAKPTHITAIDQFPLDTLKFKKLLIKRAIRNRSICIFNHDTVVSAGYLEGTVDSPKVVPV